MKGYDADNSAKKLAADKNSPELTDKVQGKLDMQNRKETKCKNLPPKISELMAKKVELNNELGLLKREKGSDGRKRQKEVKVRLKKLQDEIDKLSDERSTKKAYLDSKK